MLRKSKRQFIKFPGTRKTVAGVVAALALPALAAAATPLRSVQISSDPLTTAGAQHSTEVEPDTASFGSTIVSAFQVGRVFGGGASAIGFSTSFDAGRTWRSGLLPGLTTATGSPVGADRASDPAVAYDAAHKRWLIESLQLLANSSAVVVSGSLDARTWDPPNTIVGRPFANGGDEGGTQLDKSWIACDNSASSRFFGRCYVTYTDFSQPGIAMAVQSTDNGGVTWADPTFVPITTDVPGVQPVVRPDGQLVLVFLDRPGTLNAIRSDDGGATFANRQTIARTQAHPHGFNANVLRLFPLPSTAIDGGGTIYVAWSDCRFRRGCRADDIVVVRSTATGWSAPRRVVVPGVGANTDHVIPGLGVDEGTRGARAHLAVTFYSQRSAACVGPACLVDVRMSTSVNAGNTWRKPIRLNATGMRLSWLPRTSLGYMVGDYMGTSFANGRAVGVYALARAPRNGRLNETMRAAAQLVR